MYFFSCRNLQVKGCALKNSCNNVVCTRFNLGQLTFNVLKAICPEQFAIIYTHTVDVKNVKRMKYFT